MMRRPVLLLSLVASLSPCLADYCLPGSPASGGMRDVMLVYLGQEPERWTRERFLPYVAYLDKDAGGEARDWSYDSFLFLMFGGAPSGGSYIHGTANKADWEAYLDLLYSPDHYLAALDGCIEEVGRRLRDTEHVCPIITMVPYLARKLEQFGDVDGDGQDENPAEDADRIKALNWLIDAFLDRWRPAQYPHLRLWGFYWMNEGIPERDRAAARAIGEHLRAREMGFHWIPWFRAPGYDRWRELGFDFVVMQPNYAFAKVPRGAVVPDEGRLTRNANLARSLGLGVEMELGYNIHADPAVRLNLQLYLNHGVEELDGYMAGAVRAYYQGHDSVARLYHSDLPDCNRLYDDLYRFHKGTYQRRAVSLCEGADCRLNGRRTPLLTDGVWMTRGERPERVLVAGSPSAIDVDLGAVQVVGDVRVHVAARAEGEPAPPSAIRVLISADGQAFEHAAEVPCPLLESAGEWQSGFALLIFEPRLARALRVEVVAPKGHRVGVDEVVAFPVRHLLWGEPCRIEGDLAADSATAGSLALTDGRLLLREAGSGAVRFTSERGAVKLELDTTWYLGSALAHARWPDGAQLPSCRVTVASGELSHQSELVIQPAPARGEGWFVSRLPRSAAQSISFDLSGGPGVSWDELQVRRAHHLARDMPYVINPPFEGKYPDTDGVELTDGELTERGFGDGRTVGWYDQQPSVTLDLGTLTEVSAVRVHSEGGGYAAVRHPSAIEVWASEDGKHWRLLPGGQPEKEVTFSEEAGEAINELAWLRVDLAPAWARYVRLRFASRAWLMLSEVEIISGEDSVAGGCAYYLAPAPKPSAKYGDDGIRLTDGECTRAGGGWKKAVGWNSGTPEVVVDLMRPAEVSLVRAHCLGGGTAAVFFPRTIAVATSLDGQDWSEEVATSEVPPEAGDEELAAFTAVELAPRRARYVRLRIEPRGWAMLDEIEVYAPTQPEGP